MSEVSELLLELWFTPVGAFTTLIKFLLGLALGYVLVKALKYILAFIGIILLGSALSVWSVEAVSENTLGKLGISLETFRKLLVWFTAVLIGPIATGFIVGVIIGLIKK